MPNAILNVVTFRSLSLSNLSRAKYNFVAVPTPCEECNYVACDGMSQKLDLSPLSTR